MRLFFGLEVHAPWPEEFPLGRLLAPEARHITFAFLGETDEKKLFPLLNEIPLPQRTLGWSGQFTNVEFFPKRHPHVAAWTMQWSRHENELLEYQQQLSAWLLTHAIPHRDAHAFNPHVTLARSPFDQRAWENAFTPLPFYTSHFHLYQSLGNSTYKPIWTKPSQPPFIEIEHTADIAYQVFGASIEELFQHAQLALAFKTPAFFNEAYPPFPIGSLDALIKGLNWQIAQLDQKEIIPFKAVSYHGDIEAQENTLMWEMIVDV